MNNPSNKNNQTTSLGGKIIRVNSPREIFGVSHLVIGIRELGEGESFLGSHGYIRQGDVDQDHNLPQRSPFIEEHLAETYSMRLMTNSTGAPAVELLSENKEYAHEHEEIQPFFEAVIGNEVHEESESLLKELEAGNIVPYGAGYRIIKSNGHTKGVIALFVHCQHLDMTLSLWRDLGIGYESISSDIAHVKIHGITASSRLNVYFIADRSYSSILYMDHAGLVCFSLWCRDADRLRAMLKERSYEVGDCFSHRPFDRWFRIFFTRNISGEIYEFLSII